MTDMAFLPAVLSAIRRGCALRPVLLLASLVPPLAAQAWCPDFGSSPVAATVTASPLPLRCAFGTNWPQWHLLTPGHRTPTPHVGFRPGDARALPRLLVRYRCTGFLFAPVVPSGVALSGYVIDQPERPCAGS